MPVLVLPVAEYLDELLEDGCLAAITPLSELGRVVVVTEHVALVLVIAVRGAEDGRTHGASEMLNVIFSIQGGDVGAPQSLAAVEAEQVEPLEVIGLAERVLARRLVWYRKELGGDNFTAILCWVSKLFRRANQSAGNGQIPAKRHNGHPNQTPAPRN